MVDLVFQAGYISQEPLLDDERHLHPSWRRHVRIQCPHRASSYKGMKRLRSAPSIPPSHCFVGRVNLQAPLVQVLLAECRSQLC